MAFTAPSTLLEELRLVATLLVVVLAAIASDSVCWPSSLTTATRSLYRWSDSRFFNVVELNEHQLKSHDSHSDQAGLQASYSLEFDVLDSVIFCLEARIPAACSIRLRRRYIHDAGNTRLAILIC
jgi:hypothetical protein